jgi:hypothetical protein
MKRILLAAAIVLTSIALMPVFLYAVSCDQMEYAQIKDMDKEEIRQLFCTNAKIFEANLRIIAGGNIRASRDKDDCVSLLRKIETAYKSKFKEEINVKMCKP